MCMRIDMDWKSCNSIPRTYKVTALVNRNSDLLGSFHRLTPKYRYPPETHRRRRQVG